MYMYVKCLYFDVYCPVCCTELHFMVSQHEDSHAVAMTSAEQQQETRELRRRLQHYRQQLEATRDKLRQADVEQRQLDDVNEHVTQHKRSIRTRHGQPV